MFDILEVKLAANGAIKVIAEQEESGVRNPAAIEDALKKFSEVWNSEQCIRYRESFGKLALMAHRREAGERNHDFESYTEALQYGNLVDMFYKTRRFNSPNLFRYLSGVHTTTQLMKFNEENINNAFKSVEKPQSKQKVKMR